MMQLVIFISENSSWQRTRQTRFSLSRIIRGCCWISYTPKPDCVCIDGQLMGEQISTSHHGGGSTATGGLSFLPTATVPPPGHHDTCSRRDIGPLYRPLILAKRSQKCAHTLMLHIEIPARVALHHQCNYLPRRAGVLFSP